MKRRRLALLMACIMAFTSVDSSVLMASAAEVQTEEGEVEVVAEEVEEATEEVTDAVQAVVETELAAETALDGASEEAAEEVVEEAIIDNTLEELVDEAEMVELESDAEQPVLTSVSIEGYQDSCVFGNYRDVFENTYLVYEYENADSVSVSYYNMWSGDGYGNCVYINVKDVGDFSCITSGGVYTVEATDGDTVYDSFELTVQGLDEVAVGTLTAGATNTVQSPAGEYAYYSFVAEKDGNYRLDGWCEVIVYQEEEDGYSYVTQNQALFAATAGTTYYIGFTEYWEEDVLDVTLEWKMAIASVEISGVAEEAYPFQEESILKNATAVITYTDGSSESVAAENNCFTDSNGNEIRWRMYDEDNICFYDLVSSSLKPDVSYDVEIYNPYDGTVYHTCELYLRSLDECVTSTLQVGDNAITAWGTDNMYAFIPDEDGRYQFKTETKDTRIVIYYLGTDGYKSSSSRNVVLEMEAGTTYYVRTLGRPYDDDWNPLDSFTMAITEVPEVASVELIPGRTEVIADLENYYLYDTKVVVNYKDETIPSQTIAVETNNYIQDTYGNSYQVEVVDENYTYYYQWNSLNEGTYTVWLNGNDMEGYDLRYTITAKPVSEMVTESLTEGTQTIQAGDSRNYTYAFYKLSAEAGKRYLFSNDRTKYAGGVDVLLFAAAEDGSVISNISRSYFSDSTCYEMEYNSYYVGVGVEDTEAEINLTIKKIPEVKAVEIVVSDDQESSFTEHVEGAYFASDVKISYDDGSSQLINFEDDYYDSYENYIGLDRYRVNADGTVDTSKSVSSYSEAGSYVFRVSVGDVYADLPYEVVSMASLSQGNLVLGEVNVIEIKDGTAFYCFTPETSGSYAIEVNVPAQKLNVMDADGTYYDYYGVNNYGNDYSKYAQLEAGVNYYVRVETESRYAKANLEISKVKTITEMTTTAVKEEYIADFESFDGGRTNTTVSFDDQTSLTVDEYDVIGDVRLTYRVTKDGSDTNWADGAYLEAGTYTVSPVLNEFSSGSSITIDTSEMKVNTTTVRAVALDTTTLPVMEQDIWVTLGNGYTVKLYTFTAEEAGTYTVESDEDVRCYVAFYKYDGSRWQEVSGKPTLEAGETCVVRVQTRLAGSIRIVSSEAETPEEGTTPGTEEDYTLKAGVAKTVQVPAGGEGVYYTFTPEESGVYKIVSSENNGDPYVELYEGDAFIDSNDDGSEGVNFELVSELEAGKTYTYRMRMYGSGSGSYKVLLSKAEYKLIQSVEIVQKKDSFTVFDSLQDVLELKVTYEDQTTAVIEWDGKDEYLNVFECDYDDETDSEEYNITFYAYCFNRTDEAGTGKTVKLQSTRGNAEDLEELKVGGEAAWDEVSEQHYLRVEPLADGEYVLQVTCPETAGWSMDVFEGTSRYEAADVTKHRFGTNGNEYSVYLKGGTFYWVQWNLYDETGAGGTAKISLRKLDNVVADVKKTKDPTDLTVYRYGGVADFTGMEAEITYTDGTTETVAYGETDSQGRCFVNAEEASWIHDNLMRAYMQFGAHRIYADFTAKALEDITRIEAGSPNELTMTPGAVKSICFVPEQSGVYTFGSGNGYLYDSIWCVEDHAYVTWAGQYYYLEAGKSYVMRLYAYATNVTVVIYDDTDCVWTEQSRTEPTCSAEGKVVLVCINHGETQETTLPKLDHNWETTVTVDKEATCTVAGSKSIHCADCDAKKNVTAIKANGHTFSGAWKVTKEATAVAAGSQERTCTVCKTSKETKAIAKLKATWTLNSAGTSVLPLQQNKSVTLKVTDLAKGDKVVSWSSSDDTIATVSTSGVVKAAKKKAGTVTISIKLLSGNTITQKVKVQKAKVKTSSISVTADGAKVTSGKTLTLQQGKTMTLTSVVLPITSADKAKYGTSNKKVATVNSKGVIKGVKAGTAKITVKAGSKKFTVKVKVEGVKTTKITLNKTSIELKKKKSFTLKVTRYPSGSSDTPKFTSNNKKVATVSAKGKITAKKSGTATITVTCGGGTATCVVTVP